MYSDPERYLERAAECRGTAVPRPGMELYFVFQGQLHRGEVESITSLQYGVAVHFVALERSGSLRAEWKPCSYHSVSHELFFENLEDLLDADLRPYPGELAVSH